jgi:cyclohexa-1,5-dienecarbonyl-CoA hydratase
MTATTTTRLSLKFEAPAARITLDSPPLNVIDVPMMEELAGALAGIEQHPEISVVVLDANGKAFSAGVDVAAHSPDNVQSMLEKFHAVIRALIATKKVTIAAVHGACLGGGAELAMVCDMVLRHATPLGDFRNQTWLLSACRLHSASLASGTEASFELILTGRTLSGDEAVTIGLANQSAVAGEVPSLVENALTNLRRLSPAALSITKKAIYAWDSCISIKGLRAPKGLS